MTGSVRDALRTAVRQAMRQRDRDALAVYRTALAAIDNAESVPLDESHRAGSVEASALGVGRAEAPRRVLTEPEMIDIVLREATDRRAAADTVAIADADRAERLRNEAGLLAELVARTA